MAIDRTVKFTVRLNMLNPAHVTINKVLNELNLDIFKSKNQFFIDAATYYIENYGQEELTQPKKEKEPEFVSTEDMEAIEERIRQAAKEEARQEANKEVMTMVGSLLAAIQAGGGTMPVISPDNVAVGAVTKSISDEESEDYEEDEALVQNAFHSGSMPSDYYGILSNCRRIVQSLIISAVVLYRQALQHLQAKK